MKRIILATLISSASFCASADLLIGGDLEINTWQQSHTWNSASKGDDTSFTFEASIEHLIPLVPNVKYAQSSVDGEVLAYTKRDLTLYYEFLDNDMFSLDAGLGITNLKSGEYKNDLGNETFEGDIPHLYVATEIGIVGTPIFLFAKGTGIAYHDNHIQDISVGAQYEFPLVTFDLELQAGYRVQQLRLSSFDTLTVDIDAKTDGFFAGVNIDF